MKKAAVAVENHSMFKSPEQFFELFKLKKEFAINLDDLEKHYIALQSQYHPDKFVGKAPEEIAQATQNSSFINDGYNSLKDPVKRAQLLIQHTENINDPAVLMEIMELRESIEESSDLDELYLQVNGQIKDVESSFDEAFKSNNIEQLNKLFLKMQYLHKAKIDVKNKLCSSGENV